MRKQIMRTRLWVSISKMVHNRFTGKTLLGPIGRLVLQLYARASVYTLLTRFVTFLELPLPCSWSFFSSRYPLEWYRDSPDRTLAAIKFLNICPARTLSRSWEMQWAPLLHCTCISGELRDSPVARWYRHRCNDLASSWTTKFSTKDYTKQL